jgi:glutathione S-transferase
MDTLTKTPIVVYSSPVSGHAHRVRFFLSLLGLPHQVVDLDLSKGEHKTAEFMSVNPRGQIPAIQDGDVTVYDSNAILMYLALKYDDGTWLPTDPVAASTVHRWLAMTAGPITFGPNLARLVVRFGATADAEQARQVAARLLADMDAELANKLYALGDKPSIADVAAYAYVFLAPEAGISLASWPNVRAWLSRIESLPDFVPMHTIAQ